MEIEIGDHPDRLTFVQCVRLAADRARRAPAGVGAFVTDVRVTGDRHDWTVAVSDGRALAHVHAVEAAVPRHVPAQHRIDVLRRLGPVRVTPMSLGIAGRPQGDGL